MRKKRPERLAGNSGCINIVIELADGLQNGRKDCRKGVAGESSTKIGFDILFVNPFRGETGCKFQQGVRDSRTLLPLARSFSLLAYRRRLLSITINIHLRLFRPGNRISSTSLNVHEEPDHEGGTQGESEQKGESFPVIATPVNDGLNYTRSDHRRRPIGEPKKAEKLPTWVDAKEQR
jgi:hypothetical protein